VGRDLKKKLKVTFFVLASVVIVVQLFLYLYSQDMAVLNPKGLIAIEEKKLLIITTLLMLAVVVPVLVLTIVIACRFRSSNKKAKYSPEWDKSNLLELIWWGFPCVIVAILSVLTWKSCIALDPFIPLVSNVKPVKIQVVALQWKWLFIYPEEGVASVNLVQFPENTPLDFEITADAPMNSFWIPQLGGQIYAMPGMNTQLHLIANEQGDFKGSSSNLSGIGFAGMKFIARSSSQEDFDKWVASVKTSPRNLDLSSYENLVTPSENNPVSLYSLEDDNLYHQIIMKYMMPSKGN